MNRHFFRAEFVASVLLASTASVAPAATPLWTDAGVDLWGDATNWDTMTVPVDGDTARISNGGTAVIDDSQNIHVDFLEVAHASASTGTVRMTGGNLRTDFDVPIGGNSLTVAGGTGRLEQSGGAIFMNGGNVNVGIGPSANGTYLMSGGSLLVNSGTVFAVGNRAVGAVTQSGGSIYVRGGSNLNAAVAQLGRNTTAIGGSGSYTLSGGTLTSALLQFGNAIQTSGTPSTNTFTLQGSGNLQTGTISVVNSGALATNTFNFIGGSLSANTVSIPLTNNGGTLRPYFGNFAAGGATELVSNPIGSMTFTGTNGYTQNSTGRLQIEIGEASNDFISIGAGVDVGSAILNGTIEVSLFGGFEPALGATFDILAADVITNSATVIGSTASGRFFEPTIYTSAVDQRQVLRLVVVPEPSSAAFLASAGLLLAARRRRQS